MNKNKELGSRGESAALGHLKTRGYQILETNYISGKREIDIICEKDGILIFIEVKTRSNTKYGHPEDAIDDRKIDHILECAHRYIEDNKWEGPIRFDIISLMATAGTKLTHIEDAFF